MAPVCLSGHLDDVAACTPLRTSAVTRYGIGAENTANHAEGGGYADLTTLFFITDRCPVIVGNTLVYFDWSHLAIEYSRLLAAAMGALADQSITKASILPTKAGFRPHLGKKR